MKGVMLIVAALSLASPAFPQERPHTRTGNMRYITGFRSAALNATRNITILLPPSYMTAATRRYPVLYAMDNQNVFDQATSYIGREWQMDEVAGRMWKAGALPEFIVVGVDHGGVKRISEYTPGPGADRYLRFVMDEVKPLVDKRFKTRTGPKDTAILGSSMGGLMALWAPLRFPTVFGKGAGLSIAYQMGPELFTIAAERPRKPVRLYLDIGDAEMQGPGQAALEGDHKRFSDVLASAGYRPGTDFVARVIPGAGHNEDAWAARLDSVLTFLFPLK